MTSIERTAYPRFKRLMSAREMHVFFTPKREEIGWAQERTRSEEHLLALALALKCYQKLGYFPKAAEVPETVVEHVRGALELPEGTGPHYESANTAKLHRKLVRERQGISYDQERARQIAEEAIRRTALVKNNPPDLINVALEELVRATCELPAFRTLDEMAARVRREVNEDIFATVRSRMTMEDRARLLGLLEVGGLDRKSGLNRLKKPAKRPSWSHLKEQHKQLQWVDGLGNTDAWLEGIAPGKVADFAAEAGALDAAELRDYETGKLIALLACLVHTARRRARDDLAEMFCKRVATKLKNAKDELEEIRNQQQALVERMIGTYRTVLEHIDPADLVPRGPDGAPVPFPAGKKARRKAARALAAKRAAALALAQKTVQSSGSFAAEFADIEAVSAHHGNNHEVLVARFYKRDRAPMFDLVGTLEFEAVSEDRRVLDALAHAGAHQSATREYVSELYEGEPLDLGFASQNWQRAVRDRKRPGMLDRRPFETMVFTYLAEHLRTGDVAITGSDTFANWLDQLPDWEECSPKLAQLCEETGLPDTAAGFTAALRGRLEATAAEVDSGYPDNTDLVIDENGVPVLRKQRAKGVSALAEALEAEVKARMPERTLLGILSRTAYWVEWWRRFGPASGSDPKLKDPFGRYVLTTFVGGINMTFAEAARHIAGVSAHELGAITNRHLSVDKINEAITDVVNAFMRLDLVKAWGDGTSVAADGTQMDTFIDNLLAESSIRYGGFGGIAYHHISDQYIALFSRFVPCGVWEAVYIIDGLLKNASEMKPDTIHADTQGQSFPVFCLSHLMGFELMPRIRNWKDRTFYRPSASARYRHIDVLFDQGGGNVIDWRLVETHWRDLMRVSIAIREGTLASPLLLRRLGSNSHRNQIYRAFREVGRAVATVQLLKFISDPSLRRRVTAATNKVESFNNFTDWLAFCNGGVIAENDPVEQEKAVKLTSLLANCVIFHTTLDLMNIVRELQAEGWQITGEDLAAISPYLTDHIMRFGTYATTELTVRPDAFDPHLDVEFESEEELPTAA
ncbi:Tn3 family transposase [Streptomyces sp. NPDC048384]|uniref:Tn3 family transposase n=1 Tax=Streptomyces sp. NPDC048384 TaxID=3155487 RepID=UPI0034255BDB